MNQSPGTHWYHPHKHGSVAIQVANGMAGAFIVEDPTTGLDRFTQQYNIREHLIAFQQIDTTVGLFHGDKTNILDKVPPLVNGQNYPTIYMAPGEVQRWRIVNENVTRNTKTLEFRFQDLPGPGAGGRGGGARRRAVRPGQPGHATATACCSWAPGNRLDVIVQAPTAPGDALLPGSPQPRRQPADPRAGAARWQTLERRTQARQVEREHASAFLLFTRGGRIPPGAAAARGCRSERGRPRRSSWGRAFPARPPSWAGTSRRPATPR